VNVSWSMRPEIVLTLNAGIGVIQSDIKAVIITLVMKNEDIVVIFS